VVGRDRWARRERFGAPGGGECRASAVAPYLIVQSLRDVGVRVIIRVYLRNPWEKNLSARHASTGSGADGLCDLAGLFERNEFFDDQQGKIEGGARAAGSQQIAVGHGALVRQNRRQFPGDGEMGGVASAGEQVGVVQHGGCGADCGEPPAGGMLPLHEGKHARVGPQVFHARAAGKENAVEVAREHGGEGAVGMQRDAAAAGDMNLFAERGGSDFDTGAAQEVDRRDSFDFLEIFGKDCENGGHGEILTTMANDAQGFFRRKRLVIFGAGYVGGELARQALARGMQVTALTRNAEQAAALAALGAEAIVADLAGDAWHGRIAGGAEFVVSCVSSGGGGLDGYRRSYVEGMASILAWARAFGAAGTLVYTSSTSVYPQDGGVIVDETAPTTGAGERAQLLLEAEAQLYAREKTNAPAVLPCQRWFVLRLAGIYGPGRHHLLEQVRAGEIGGRGDHPLNLIHRDDIVTAVWAVLGAPPAVADEIFNVADDGAASKAEITAWLAAQIGVPVPRFTGEPAAGRRAVTPDRVIANRKLKTMLGWQPHYPSFREGYANLLSR
jgi:nucleoside-diphosphate-sugar epimerase